MILSLVTSFVGIGGLMLSLFLFHKKRHQSESFVCPLRGKCSEVIHSDFSKFLGIPVEIMGVIYYSVVSLGYLLTSIAPDSTGSLEAYLLLVATAAFLFSLYLTFIQIVTLRKLCTWCLLSASFCLCIFLLSFIGSFEPVVTFLVHYQSTLIIIHVFSVSFGMGAATLANVFFLKFLKDARISLEESEILSTLSESIWLALCVIVISGATLFLPHLIYQTLAPSFWAKILVVCVIIFSGAMLNLLIAPKLILISFGKEHDHKKGELARARRIAFMLGPISLVSWYWALYLGLFSAGTSFYYPQFLRQYLFSLVISAVIGLFIENRIAKRDVPWPIN